MFPVFRCSVIVCSYYILLNFYFQLIPPISFIILLQERSIPWVFIYALWEIWIAKLSKMIFYLLIWTWAPLGSGDAQHCQKYQLTLWVSTSKLVVCRTSNIYSTQFEPWFEFYFPSTKLPGITPHNSLSTPWELLIDCLFYILLTLIHITPSLFAALLTMKGKVTASELRERTTPFNVLTLSFVVLWQTFKSYMRLQGLFKYMMCTSLSDWRCLCHNVLILFQRRNEFISLVSVPTNITVHVHILEHPQMCRFYL